MSKLVENYLSEIQSEEIVTEGIKSLFRRIGEFFSGGRPRDKKLDRLESDHHECVMTCERVHPPQIRRKKHYSGNPYSEDYKEWEEIEKIESPEFAKCSARCKIKYAQSTLDWIKRNGRHVCAKNENEKRCLGWIKRTVPQLQSELKALGIAIDKAEGDKIIQITVK